MPSFSPNLPRLVGRTLNGLNRVAPAYTGDTLLRLFGRPRAGRLTPADARFLATAERAETVAVAAWRVRTYHWNADGPDPILLLHGWESNTARWEPLIRRLLPTGRHIVAFDGPAHGASSGRNFTAIDYAACIDRMLDRYPAALAVAHSLGGMALTYYLTAYAGSPLQRLALLGVPSDLEYMMGVFQDILRFDARSRASLEAAIVRRFGRHPATFSVRRFCAQIDLPALIIHDRDDDLAPLADSEAYARLLDPAELVITEGLGHSLQGEVVYGAIARFVEQ